MKKMPDWLIRAIKTFVQAFFGVLVPEVVVILQHGWPESWSALWDIWLPWWRRLWRRLFPPCGTSCWSG